MLFFPSSSAQRCARFRSRRHNLSSIFPSCGNCHRRGLFSACSIFRIQASSRPRPWPTAFGQPWRLFQRSGSWWRPIAASNISRAMSLTERCERWSRAPRSCARRFCKSDNKQHNMPRSKPPFRADHVGSLLRPPALKEARSRRERGEISADALAAVEDREIEKAIRKQEEIGLQAVTDGEFRRAFWNYDFLGKLDGVEAYLGERKIKFQGAQPRPMMLRVAGKLGAFTGHPMIEHFKFVQSHTKRMAKMTIPSPSSLHFRYGRDAVPQSIYPVMDDFYRDLGNSYRKATRAFAEAGCRYLQLDEVNFTYLCDPKLREVVANRGEDPQALPHVYAGMINTAISDLPDDMAVTMHLCRGNFRSSFVAWGGYGPVAEIL